MAEKLMDFFDWVKIQMENLVEEEYYFVHDDDGNVLYMFCNHSIDPTQVENKVQIDNSLASEIHNGIVSIQTYKVNTITKEVIKINPLLHTLTRIDDVLHRIPDKQWANIDNPDIMIIYNSKNNTIAFELNSRYNNVILSGDTNMMYHITEYNDPNILKQKIEFKVGDLLESKKVYELTANGEFSVYTRRIFENYIFEKV